jgi:long-chain acyl-CoA synthetase
MNIGRIWRSVSSGKEDRVALVDETKPTAERITFGEIEDRANRFANGLLEFGLEPGDSFATMMNNSAEFFYCFFGAAKAGITICPLHIQRTPDNLAHQLDRVDAPLIVSDDVLLEKTNDVVAESEQDISTFVHPVSGGSVANETELSDFLSDDITQPEIDVGDHDIFQVLFTSGTTGEPKGVQISHTNVYTGSVNWALDLPDLDRDAVLGQWLPIFHNGGHWSTFGSWLAGASVVLQRGYEAEEVARAIEEYDITHVWGHPTMFPPLLDLAEQYDISSLDLINYAMAPMPMEIREAFDERFDVKTMSGAGQTECFPATNWFFPEHRFEKEGNYWGVSATMTEMKLMDDDGDLIDEPGIPGEIVTRGPNVMEGYLDKSREEGVYENGWLRWGDLGVYDEDGLLKFVDRKKHIIKTGGENVSSVKIENRLRSHESVEDAVVVGLSHERWAEAVTAFVQTSEETSEDELIDFCADGLADFEVPKRIIQLEELPLTETGKVQKHIIEDQYSDLYRDAGN